MGSILHANATTTPRIRKEIQASNQTLKALAKKYNLNVKTVAKWKNTGRITDKKSGPSHPRSTVLSELEEKTVCEFRRITRFPLDDVFVALMGKIPRLTRSNLYRCLLRHGLNRLPVDKGEKRVKKPFKHYRIGYVHVDISEIHTAEGKAYMFVGIERATKYAYVEVYLKMTQNNACLFLTNFIADCPFKIHTLLTDNGAQFTYRLLAEHLRPRNKTHPFDNVCEDNNIEHRLTKFRHPWTNGQVEIMNKVIKSHTVKKFSYEDLKSFKEHLMSFLLVYNYQKKLKSLKYQSPYDKMLELFAEDANNFKQNPNHKIAGLNN
ncbi:MAG: transposase [Nitrosopumilus sp.]|nr:transposase [Nitrosopumilus sp.]